MSVKNQTSDLPDAHRDEDNADIVKVEITEDLWVKHQLEAPDEETSDSISPGRMDVMPSDGSAVEYRGEPYVCDHVKTEEDEVPINTAIGDVKTEVTLNTEQTNHLDALKQEISDNISTGDVKTEVTLNTEKTNDLHVKSQQEAVKQEISDNISTATQTTQAEPVRSTNEVPSCSTSSSAVYRPTGAAGSRPSASFSHGQLIRSTSTVTHSNSSADTLPDVRTSTPETGVGRATGDLGRLFQRLTGHSSPLFDEEENSSREITINLMPIVENPIQDEPPGGHDGSETPDILEECGDAQPDEIHTPENLEEPVETQAPPITQETGALNIDNTPAEGLLADVGLREMLTLARQYREDHRDMQNIINPNIERWAALSEKNIELEMERNDIERQKLQLQREMFQWQRRMDEENNLQINRALSITERTLQSLLSIVSEREGTTDPKRPRLQ
ncbi:uncharacterized protein LOC128657157 [Bombina bombina]|uniref:uncharacterized protein LOC128657157 n=1 Tax=Bombina bombina TaxID=8345 RepID=UPI00235A6723|nr:uncharacterized protein LOC128657157 [Bombina bombina]